MARKIVNIIDLGSQNIKILSAERSSPEKSLHIIGAVSLPSAGIRRGILFSKENADKRVREAVKEIERFSGIPFRSAYLVFGTTGLSFHKVLARVAVSQASGEVSQYDVDRVLAQAKPSSRELQNREILEAFGLNYYVDSDISFKDPISIKGENLEAEVLFITALIKPLNEIISMVENAGIGIDDVIPSPLAAGRALLSARQREAGAIVLDIGADTLGFAIFEENLPYSAGVFPFGGSHITNDIALGFQIDLDRAEEIKISQKAPEDSPQARKKLQNIIEARLEDMFELVNNHLKKVSRQGLLPGGVVVGGGSAKIQGLEEFSRRALSLPANLGKCHELDSGHKLHDPMWAASLGGALWALDKETESYSVKRPSILKQKIASWLRTLIP